MKKIVYFLSTGRKAVTPGQSVVFYEG
ncbi:MAG: aminomethyltransferase beta-barrel domain-containing protein [Gammaproteobacteria bacterium]